MSIKIQPKTVFPSLVKCFYHPWFKLDLKKYGLLLTAWSFFSFLPVQSSLAEIQTQTQTSELRQLKVEAFKRELRALPPKQAASETYQSFLLAYDENRFEDLVRIFEQLLPTEKDANSWLMFGNTLLFAGQKTDAVSAFQQAFKIAKTPKAKSAALANFGILFSMSDRWDEAASWLEKALEIDRETDHWLGQGLALSQLGVFYYKLGNTEKGAAAHIEALEIAETMDIPWLQARQLSQLAGLYYRDKVYHLARDYYQKAIEIYQTIKDPISEAGALTALGFVHKESGKIKNALVFQRDALEIYTKLQDRENASKVWLNMSLMHRDIQEFEKALDAANEAYKLQKEEHNPTILAEIEGTMGTIQEKKGNLAEAIAHLKKARRYFEEAGASQEIHVVDLRIQTLEDQLAPPF